MIVPVVDIEIEEENWGMNGLLPILMEASSNQTNETNGLIQ